MYNIEIDVNSTYYLELFVTDTNGNPVTGLSVTYSIYKSIDNTLISNGALTEIGNGVYQKSYIFNTIGQYRVIYTTPTNYTDEIETIMVRPKVATEDVLLRILGLSQENYRIFNPVYDSYKNMTSATIKIYSNATDCDNDVSPLATYEVTATYIKELMKTYKFKRTA